MTKTKSTIFLCVGIVIVAICACIGITYNVIHRDDNYVNDVYRHRLELSYYGAKDTLVSSIDTYIQKSFKGSCMNGLAFVDASETHDIDLLFILSQCQIESGFATTGLGAKMNSAFNVGAFDGKGTTHMKKYKHPDLSIEPYINLLFESYLVDGKTEMELMEKYVNSGGKRYATSTSYEQNMRSIYKKLSDSEIGERYEIFKKYKILSGK